jgi:transposase
MLILAIDLGMSKSVSCLFDTQTGATRYHAVATGREALRQQLVRLRPELVVVEICPLAAMVHDLGLELAIKVLVADTTQDAWRWRNVKRKTDRDDALKLARLAALGQLNAVYIPAPPMRQRRALVEQRCTVVREQTRCKNRIRALLVRQEVRLPRGKMTWTAAAVMALQEVARPLKDCAVEELWRGMLHVELQQLEHLRQLREQVESKLNELADADPRVLLLETVPGVGRRTAEVVVTVLDEARRFANRRQVGAYAGLTPRRYQSGDMDRQGRISKRGNPLLRLALNQAAWAAVRYSPHFREVFMRVSRLSKARRKQAIVAVMHHLLVVCWAMLRDGQRYRAPTALPQAPVAA